MSATQKGLLATVLLALILRLAFCVFIVGVERAPKGDETDYHALATRLAQGQGYTLDNGQITARRPPLYPVLLSFLYKVTGPSVAAARIFQVILGTLVVWLVLLVARRYFSERTAWIAAALTAVNPFLIFISSYLFTENLYVILLLLFLIMVPRPEALLGSWRPVIVAGFLLGLAALVRPTAFMFAIWVSSSVALPWVGRLGGRVARVALLLVVVFLTLIPWAVRNQTVFGKWILLTTHGGITFYQGNNPVVMDTPRYHGGVAPFHALPGYERLRKMTEVDKDEASWAMGKQYLSDNKGDVPVLVVRKLGRFWRLKSDVGISGVKSGWWWSRKSFLGRLATTLDVGLIYALFVLPLFVGGLVATFKDYRRLLLPYGLIAVHTLTAMIFFGSLRMRIPIEPVIAIFAAEMLRRVAGRLLQNFSRVPAQTEKQ